MKILRALSTLAVLLLVVTVTFAQVPSITSFSPTAGPAGTTVTLTGSGFNATAANNIVFFGATQATVSVASATSLTVTVPVGATYQPITVLNGATVLQGSSAMPFITTFTPNKGAITAQDISAKVDFATGTAPYSVAIGDLDGDGKPDLAVANSTGNTVSVYRNTSASGSIAAGSFAAKVDFATGTAPRSVAIGDLDGDGKPDLAVVNYTGNTVSVLRNTSASGSIAAGSFAAKVDFATGTSPRSVAIGDLDGDGKPDLAVANYHSNTVSVLRNTSASGSIAAGSFAAKFDFATGIGPYSVAIGDLDGDGKPDLAVINSGSNNVSILRNTSASGSIAAGSFAAKVDFDTGTNPFSVAIGDLDGDGKPDLAVANSNESNVSVLRNTSASGSIAAGSFAARVDFATGFTPFSVAIGDLDGDGKPDLAAANYNSNTVSILRNTSASGSIAAGSFAATVDFATGTIPRSVAIGDLDGDGKPDLAVANSNDNTVSILRNNPVFAPVITSFSPTTGPAGTTVTLTGSGFNTTANNNVVFFGATQATVSVASTTSLTVSVPVGATYQPITVLNGATVLQGSSAMPFTTTFTPNKGAITAQDISAKVDFATGTAPFSVAIGDLDGDGKPDLAVANSTGNTVSVYRNTSASGSIAAGSFAAKVDFSTGLHPYSVAIGDLDGDGKPDLAVANPGSNTVSVLRNTSASGSIAAGSFAAKVDFDTGIAPYSVAIGDLDGDGKPDLAVANFSSNTVSVLRNTSASGSIAVGSFAAKVDFATGTSPRSVAIGDLEGDGKPDLAVANYNSNTVSVLRNTSASGSIDAGSFAATVDFATGSHPYSIAIGDLDGDGKPDLAVANSNNNTVSILRNTSASGSIAAGSFAAKVDLATGFTPYSVAIGDLDGDGKPDLAVANFSSNTVSVLRNTSASGSIAAGSFAAKVDFATGTTPRSVAIGDMDGDGKPDLAVANDGNTTVSILRNNSILPPVITSFSPASGPAGTTVTIAGTGFNATAANNIVFFGATQATVSVASATSLTVTVPVGATYQPITVLNGATVLQGSSAMPFITTFTPNKGAITAQDISAKVDFATGTAPYSVAIGDLDGDGKPDLAVANNTDNTVSVYRNTSASGSIAAGSFAAKVDFATGTAPRSVAIGDLDGDGKPDLAVVNYSGNTVSVLRNTSASGSIAAGSFAAKVDFATGTAPRSVAIGDLDGDGKPDLAVANYNSNTVSVLRNTSASGSIAAGSFAAKVDFATGIGPYSVAIGDLDGDGKPDLAVANSGSNNVSILRNTSASGSIAAGSFAAKVDFATGTAPRSVAIGDLDGDGKPDLAVVNYTGNTVSVLRNTSASGSIAAGSFAAKVDLATGFTPYSVAIGDLDGDGKPDLAVANASSSTVSVLRNTSASGSIAAGSFAAKVDFATGTTPRSVAIGDLDGDGKPDLAVANDGTSTVSILRNNPVFPPTITATGTLAAVNTTYGTASASPTSFAVTGSLLTADITATAPTGFEISTTAGGTYSSTLTLSQTGGAYSGNVYVRLASATIAGTYTGNVVLSSTGATDATIATTSSDVAKAILTYTATAASKTYGDANPSFTGTVTGFVNSETQGTATTGTLAFTSAATATSAAGSYAINGSGLSATNYTFAQAAGNATALTINKAALTYTATAASKTYGDANPSFTGTVTGFVNSETVGTATTGTLAFTSPAATTSAAGSYAINGSGLSATNYTFAQAAGNATALTINKAALTYTATAASKTYGDANPTFAGTVTGFVNSETLVTATTGTLAFTSAATATSAAGSYAINGSGLSATNYTFAQAAGNATALTINKAALTYTATAASKTYGDANPSFTGTVTGFVNSETVGTATTGTLAFTSPAATTSAAGSYAINGSGLSATNYTFAQAAGNATALTINKAALTYTANNASKTYGDANPAFTGSVTGFVNSDTQASATTGTLAFTSPATTSSAAGSYAINGSGLTATNYTFAQATGNGTALTINKAALTYTANAASKTYGSVNPALSGTVTGFVNGDTQGTATTGTLAFTTTATAASPVGSYGITGSGLSAGNYTFAQASANTAALTIGTATLNVTADSKNKVYGSVNPALTISYSGFMNGDNAAGLTSAPTVSTAALTSSPVNTYPITVSGGASTNYTISYTTGTLSIDRAALSITADNQSKVYGAVIPALTVSYSGFVNGDNAANLSTQPTTTTTAVDNSAAGSYPITSSGATSNNYNIAYVPGVLTVGAASQTITFTASTAKTYGEADFAPGATSNNSSIAITYTSDNNAVATIVNGKIHIISAGTVNIKASQAGNANYNAATDVIQSLTINKAAITITATAANKTYGTTDPALPYIVTSGALVGTDTFTGSLSRAAGETVSTYAITQGTVALNSNYVLSYAGANFSITKANLTVTASSATKIYGAANPALTVSYAGFVGTDNATSLTTQPTVTTAATTTSPVGSYPTMATGGVSANYTFSYIVGTLTVSQATLNVTASSASKVYGAANPALTVSYTGFVGTDNAASLTSQPTVTTAATTTSPVGTYPITASGAASGNYSFSYIPGVLTVVSANQAITFAALPNQTYGAADFAPGATSDNSTIDITYSSDNAAVATIVNGKIHIVSAGTANIKASQAGSANYTAAMAMQTLTVNKAIVTVSATAKNKTYGDTDPELTYTNSVLVNGDAFTGALTRDAGENAGTYAIKQGTLALSSNYTLTYAGANLSIGAKALTIAADNKTKVYGTVNPPLTVIYTGFANGDDATKLTSQATASNTATIVSPVGTYPVTASGAASNNYTISYTAGTLTVTKANLAIAAENKTKVYGSANPALIATYTGFVNGDDATKLTTQATLATTAIVASAVGNYPITASGASSSNYNISYTAGALTVNKANLSIAADNKTKPYGVANPTLTATYTGFVNGDTNASLTTQPSLVTTATAASAAGNYPITASGAASVNYNISYTAGILSVTGNTLTITANNAGKKYGAANPALTFTYSGFINGDTPASLSTLPSVSTTATAASGAGTYPITVSGAVSTNYTIIYVPATLTVSKAILDVSADNKSRNYGAANPALTVSYNGFVNGDTQAALTTPATAVTNATIASLPGTYAIIASGAASANYNFTYSSGTFAILPVINATMVNLAFSSGNLSPGFSGNTYSYKASVIYAVNSITLTPTADATATITVNGIATGNGSPSAPIALNPGDNTITTIVTAQDGVTKLTYTVIVHRALPAEAIVATNILSPNGDGKNDTWIIKDIDLYPGNKVTVYDGAGREVYSKTDYKNDWAGTVNSAPLSQGTYYYTIFLGPGYETLKGFITIVKVQ